MFSLKAEDYYALPTSDASPEHSGSPSWANGARISTDQRAQDERAEC